MQLLEVKIKESDNFLKIVETLSRIGLADYQSKTLEQVCYILHKTGRYYIMHRSELLKLDRVLTDIENSDIAVRNTVANLLEQWSLLSIVNPSVASSPKAPMSDIKIIAFRDKPEWKLVQTYNIGKV